MFIQLFIRVFGPSESQALDKLLDKLRRPGLAGIRNVPAGEELPQQNPVAPDVAHGREAQIF